MKIHPFVSYLKYLIIDCYEEYYDPYYAENWYFLYRRFKLRKNKSKFYKHTPIKLIIGSDF